MKHKKQKQKYYYVIEKAKNNYSAYLPDIPGCIATGSTLEEAKEIAQEIIDHGIGVNKNADIALNKDTLKSLGNEV